MNRPVYETLHQMGCYSKFVIFLLLGFFPFLGIGLIVLGIYTSYVSIVDDGYPVLVIFVFLLLVIGVSVFFLMLGWAFISAGLASYHFAANGLQVKYPLRVQQLIPWDEFQQVCIVYSAFTTRGRQRANVVICCVKKGEIKNIHGRWKTDNPFRYRSVISIAYTPELHQGIKDRYPYEVFDLRETQPYKLN